MVDAMEEWKIPIEEDLSQGGDSRIYLTPYNCKLQTISLHLVSTYISDRDLKNITRSIVYKTR